MVAEFWHPQDSRSPYNSPGHAYHNTHGQMTMSLHTYRSRQFKWIRFGVNRLSVSGVLASARFQEPLSCPRTRPLRPHCQITMTLHTYRPRRFQWAWFGVNCPSNCGVPASAIFQEPLSHPSACPWCHHGQITMRCTPTDQDTSNEPGLGWIGPVVAEFWHPQDSSGPFY